MFHRIGVRSHTPSGRCGLSGDLGSALRRLAGGPCLKNVTVTLPEDVARWLRIRAAEDDRSVSRWLADVIEGMRRREDEYEIAMEQALAVKPETLNESGAPYPSRDALYDRPGPHPRR
jgi:plasmid stability protein